MNLPLARGYSQLWLHADTSIMGTDTRERARPTEADTPGLEGGWPVNKIILGAWTKGPNPTIPATLHPFQKERAVRGFQAVSGPNMLQCYKGSK